MNLTYENCIIKELQELNNICNAQNCDECDHIKESPCSIRNRILELEFIIGD